MSNYQNKVEMLYSLEELDELKKNCEKDNGEYRSELLLTYLKQEKNADHFMEDNGEYRSELLLTYLKEEKNADHFMEDKGEYTCDLLKKKELSAKDMKDAMLVPCTNYIPLDDNNDYL